MRILVTAHLVMVISGLAVPAAGQSGPWHEIEVLREAGQRVEALERVRALMTTPLDRANRLEAARLEHALLHDLARYDAAVEAGRGWILLAANSGLPLIQAHFQTARTLTAQSKNAEGLDHLTQARSLLRTVRDVPLEISVLLEMARATTNLSRYPEALAGLDEADRLLDVNPDPTSSARSAGIRAQVATYRGLTYEGLELHERALTLARRTNNPSFLSSFLTNLGQAHMVVSQYPEALGFYREALDGAPTAAQRAILHLSVGICQYEMNQFDDARLNFEEALRIATGVGDLRSQAIALGELGLTSSKADGGGAEAVEYYDRAVELLDRIGDRRNAVMFLSNKAVAARDAGRFDEALRLYREVERRTLAIPGLKLPAAIIRGLGQVLAELGRTREAEAMLQRAVRQATADRDTKRVWEASVQLARLYIREKQFDRAESSYLEALKAIETLRRSLRLDTFKADFFEDKVHVYAEYAAFTLARDSENGPRRSFEVAERARARSLLDSLTETRAFIQETLPAPVLDEERRLLLEISDIQAELRRGQSDPSASRRLAETEKHLEDFHIRVRKEHPRFRNLRYPEPADLAAVQSVLRTDEALIAYMLGEKGSLGWWISREAIHVVTLLPGPVIETQARQALSGLGQAGAAPELGPVAEVLLKPFQGLIRPPRNLIIAPWGILHYLPFEVLPAGPDQTPLVVSSTVSYVPSATILVDLRRNPPAPVEAGLLAVADPVYVPEGEAQVQRSAAALGMQPPGNLPHTRTEARNAAYRFDRLHSTLLLGEQATEAQLKRQDLEKFSVVHLAVHGWIDSHQSSRSGLLLGMDGPDSVEDGILQVREIFRLKLRASMVVLSACQSALGRLVTGEGMVGLTHAFFYAGARSVVATLWNVNDEASADFSTAFYEALGRGETRADALRTAKVSMRKDPRYSHPYYWAGYVLIGEGAEGVSFPVSLLRTALAAVLVVAVMVAVAFFLRSRQGAITKSIHGDSAIT